MGVAVLSSPTHFNPHPHTEDDKRPANPWNNGSAISIHILTRRMTPSSVRRLLAKEISIHILTRRMTAAFGISYSEIQHI